MSGGRPKRLARILLSGVIILAVILLGWALTPRKQSEPTTQATSSKSSKSAEPKKQAKADDSWSGLRSAEVPLPGGWSADKARHVKDEKPDMDTDPVTLDASYGPTMGALKTLNALTNRNGDNEQWGLDVSATMGPDGTGRSYPAGDVQRWWFAKRTFKPDSLCHPGDAFQGSGVYPGQCEDGTYPESNASVLVSQHYDDAVFPVPSDLKVDDLTDPQEIVGTSYATVYVPMDDGVWTFTEYCPASLTDYDTVQANDPSHLTYIDKKNRETKNGGSDAYWPLNKFISAYGTREHPCVTVEYTVAGQIPFWYSGD